MNMNLIEGQWKQWSGTAMLRWERIMNDDMTSVADKYEELVRKRQEKYRIVKKEARRQVNELVDIVEQLKISNNRVMKYQKSLSKKRRS
jgi:uncharacterized protein YjbJ (UPF0337 family)